MEQRVQTLWSDWSPPATQARTVPAAPAEIDLVAYVRILSEALGADDALLSLHFENSGDAAVEVAASGTSLPQSFYAQLAAFAAPRAMGTQAWSSPSVEPDWSTCMLDQRQWHVLRLSVWSRRSRTCAVLSLLFKTASLADRSRTLGKLETLRPMAEPYLRLWQRTRVQNREAAGLRGALDSMEIGVMMVDRSSKIIFANKAADGILTAGEPLRKIGESFAATDLRQAVPLHVALSHAIADNFDADSGSDSARVRRASILALRSQRLGRSLVLSVAPAEQRATEPSDVAAIVYIIDPKLDTTKQLQPVCALFGLSPVESRLVCLLTAGQTLQDAAKAMRIKDQTARSYLKQIFSKTDTRRQADLVRVMLCSLLRTERTIEPVSLKGVG